MPFILVIIIEESDKAYGAPRINKTLRGKGIVISLNRTQRFMNKLVIKSIVVKRFKSATSKSKTEGKENVLKGDFSTNTITEK
ncbi:IS3 family transposase [Clostridium sp. MSJ-4]|uniref:IS3 family transposase n=1 Tax=Clostridium simiarum TaxID=2841506 RepID=A0ABS6F641_9CLOT|nr:IS3 family transposase [Clostridium simiarum]